MKPSKLRKQPTKSESTPFSKGSNRKASNADSVDANSQNSRQGAVQIDAMQIALPSNQSQEDIIRHEAYVIASLAAAIFSKADDVKASVDRAEEILKLSKEASSRLNTPRGVDRQMNFKEFAMAVCRDTNANRAVVALSEFKFERVFDSLVRNAVQKIQAEEGREVTKAEMLRVEEMLKSEKKDWLKGFRKSSHWESEIPEYQEAYKLYNERTQAHRAK